MYCDARLGDGAWGDRDVAMHACIKRFGAQLKELTIDHMARNKESFRTALMSL